MRIAILSCLAAGALLGLSGSVQGQTATQRGQGGGLSVKWVGQDGHDYVGPSNRIEPSDIQDVHIILSGLNPAREIKFIDMKAPDGGEQWQFNPPSESFCWKIEVKREKGSRTADLFFEPGTKETAREYQLTIKDDQDRDRQLSFRGRQVNRGLRMPGAKLQAEWHGQEKQDHVGVGPSVGPDGIQDVRVRLTGLSTKLAVKAIRIEGPGKEKWEFGVNPNVLDNAEFLPDPKQKGEGDLFLQAARDLKGIKLKVTALYENDLEDAVSLTAGRCAPQLKMPQASVPKLTELSGKVEWLGQDGRDVTGLGDVHVRITGLKRLPSIASAVLSDSARGAWLYTANANASQNVDPGQYAGPLALQIGANQSEINLFFSPYRDEKNSELTLRLINQDGQMGFLRFPGQECDISQCAPQPANTTVEAKPGDDLNALARQYGTIHLTPGTYRLDHPLILEQPNQITGETGKATLVFSQAPSDSPWTTAIKIHHGNTTLNGFTVRFEGPIRWDQDVSYGPAVIGTTDNKDQPHPALKVNIVLTRLDLEIPEPPDPSKWIEALRLVRLTNARSGMIAGNILRGGPIEFFDGPWQMLNNDFRGTPPGTYSHGVFTGHATHDLTIKGNRAKPILPDGKTWRFLVLTHRGVNTLIEENTVEGLGFLDDDTIPDSNEPEIILTEAYHVRYEGRVAGLSPDGRVLRIAPPQGEAPMPGDAVSLLTGASAGQYRRIDQVIDKETFLVDPPIPKGTEVVSISQGFIHTEILKNRIDIRGGKTSGCLILPGNNFGTRVIGNHFLGGSHAMRFAAYPSETPRIWGWTHAPFLQGEIEGNRVEDCSAGVLLSVEHSPRYIKTAKGRTYMTITLKDNHLVWTEPFLRKFQAREKQETPPGIVLGHEPSHDPAEFVVTAADNRLDAPSWIRAPNSLTIRAALYNKSKMINRESELPRRKSEALSESVGAKEARR